MSDDGCSLELTFLACSKIIKRELSISEFTDMSSRVCESFLALSCRPTKGGGGGGNTSSKHSIVFLFLLKYGRGLKDNEFSCFLF